MRVILAAGGAYMFYYGTDPDVPETMQGFAALFLAIGIAMIVFAVFSQKIFELRHLSKINREGGFPDELEAGKAGVLVRYTDSERYFFYAQVGAINDFGDYFKLGLKVGGPAAAGPAAIFIFKKDFEQGEPEAFKLFIKSKTV